MLTLVDTNGKKIRQNKRIELLKEGKKSGKR